jgi:bacteriocin biosynthesis cyclodehydratase domain-containing protein
VVVAAPDLVVCFSELDDSPLEGRLLPLLVPLLDGSRSVREIAEALEGRASPVDVRFGLALLEEGGWLAPRGRPAEPPAAVPIGVRVLGETRTGPPGARGAVQLVVTDDYRRPELHAVDRQAREAGRSWMPLKPEGTVIWMGPIIQPAASPCWRCVTKRLDQTRPLRALFAASASYGPSGGQTSPIADVALALVGRVLARQNEATRAKLQQHIVTIDPRVLTSAWHDVMPDPDCRCQRRAARRHARWRLGLSPQRKTLIADGGYRTVSAEDTFTRYARHISPVTGVVRSVEPYYDDPHGLIHVYAADHPFVVDPLDRAATRRGFRRKSTGKGMTAAQARTSALCEALERHSGIYRGSEVSQRATFEALGDRAIHPNACLGFSVRQFAQRAAANRVDRPETWVPQRFQEDTPVAWTEAWSLTHRRSRFVPTAYCYYGYPRDPQHDFCRADSNGCAAGNTTEEAVLQGFFELVERDAVAMWWYNRVPRPGVDLSAFAHPYVRALIDRYRGLGRRVDVLDLTTDLCVPVFAAISRERRTGGGCIFGFGAHFDAEIAAARALTEANQFLPAALAHTLPDRYGPLARQPFLNPSPTVRPPVASRCLADPTDDLRADVRRAVATVHDRRLEMLVVDQTRPDVGLPVVKVIIPGMRPFWPRFAPGRLYDVPVRLGWRRRASNEEDLNPVAFVV